MKYPGPPRGHGVGTGTGASNGFIGCMSALLLLPAVGMVFAALEVRSPIAAAFLVAVAALMVFGLPASRVWRFLDDRSRTQRLGDAAMRKFAAGCERVEIAGVPEGLVKVRGTVRVLRPTAAPDGALCAAVESHRTDDSTTTASSRGGIFALDDGSGVPAEVRARFVRVVGRSDGDDLRVVPDGAEVEVVGRARWVAAELAGLRDQARAVVLEGSESEPLVLRVVAEHGAPRGGTAVRVGLLDPSMGELVDDASEAADGARAAERTA